MTDEEIAAVEKLVNDEIAAALPVETMVMTLDEAKKTGAMALFGEKYGDSVRAVSYTHLDVYKRQPSILSQD